MSKPYKSATAEEQASELVRLRDKGHLEVVSDTESAYFSNGSALCRLENLPWTPFPLAGSAFKLISVEWQRDMYVFMLVVPGGVPVATHYHLAEAYGYIITGSFEYEFGNVFAGDFVCEGVDIEHGAILGPEDVLQVSIIFGGLTGVGPKGGPDLDSYFGCMEIYEAAKANNAAGHIKPPPAGWSSPILEAAKRRFAA